MEVEVVAKKWGNSIGVVIPKQIADELGLHEGATFFAEFKKPKKTVLRELWESGLLRDTNMTTEELLAETRKGWSKWIQ